MAIANQKVKFAYTTSTAYANLQATDPNTIYFLADTQQIFLGSINYAPSEVIATDSIAGVVKLDEDNLIEVDGTGTLMIGGRFGEFPDSTGVYVPNDRAPRNVGNHCLLITDAIGMQMTNSRSFALVTGLGTTCKRAAAGTTEYHYNNTYTNRLLCKIAENGFASIDEATSKVEQIIPVLSVTIDGNTFTPDSAPNDSTKDIVITTERTLNPDTAITNVRLFGTMGAYATAHIGNGVASETGGRNLLLGGGIAKVGNGNDNCVVGNGMYVTGNGNACFGRYHIAAKNRGFFAGTGHDSTNAKGEGAAAVGAYSNLTLNTAFAVGDGSDHSSRNNCFELQNDGGLVLQSPNGSKWRLIVDDSGNLVTTAVV